MSPENPGVANEVIEPIQENLAPGVSEDKIKKNPFEKAQKRYAAVKEVIDASKESLRRFAEKGKGFFKDKFTGILAIPEMIKNPKDFKDHYVENAKPSGWAYELGKTLGRNRAKNEFVKEEFKNAREEYKKRKAVTKEVVAAVMQKMEAKPIIATETKVEPKAPKQKIEEVKELKEQVGETYVAAVNLGEKSVEKAAVRQKSLWELFKDKLNGWRMNKLNAKIEKNNQKKVELEKAQHEKLSKENEVHLATIAEALHVAKAAKARIEANRKLMAGLSINQGKVVEMNPNEKVNKAAAA